MRFTALHRALGRGPGPLTDELLDSAVAAGATESDDLDWKSELPPQKGLPQTDFPKDVAAMANSGGGLIVFGVHESQKAATGRTDVGDFDEGYERSLPQRGDHRDHAARLRFERVPAGFDGRRACRHR